MGIGSSGKIRQEGSEEGLCSVQTGGGLMSQLVDDDQRTFSL